MAAGVGAAEFMPYMEKHAASMGLDAANYLGWNMPAYALSGNRLQPGLLRNGWDGIKHVKQDPSCHSMGTKQLCKLEDIPMIEMTALYTSLPSPMSTVYATML